MISTNSERTYEIFFLLPLVHTEKVRDITVRLTTGLSDPADLLLLLLLLLFVVGYWSSEHQPFANYVLRYARQTSLIGIRVVAKSAGSEIPDLHL
jgi:hypothetical protein